MSTRHPLRRFRVAALLALTMALCACYPVVGRDYRAPAVATPSSYPVAPVVDGVALSAWWASFHDEEIVSLVSRALARSGDMRMALMRVRESRAALGLSDAALGPSIGADSSVERQALSHYTYIPFAIPPFTDYRAGFDASWELDIWGVVARQREQAAATLAAEGYNACDTANMVSAEVVRLALELRVLHARAAAVARAYLHLGPAGRHGGHDRTRQCQPDLATTIQEARRRPGGRARRPGHSRRWARAPTRISMGLAALLLDAEPDALRARARAPCCHSGPAARAGDRRASGSPAPTPRCARGRASARRRHRRSGHGRGRTLPRISLSGSFRSPESIQHGGTASAARALTWGIGPSVSWNIVDWGRVRAGIHVADRSRSTRPSSPSSRRSSAPSSMEVGDALSAGIDAHDDADLPAAERALRDTTAADALEQVLVERGLSDAAPRYMKPPPGLPRRAGQSSPGARRPPRPHRGPCQGRAGGAATRTGRTPITPPRGPADPDAAANAPQGQSHEPGAPPPTPPDRPAAAFTALPTRLLLPLLPLLSPLPCLSAKAISAGWPSQRSSSLVGGARSGRTYWYFAVRGHAYTDDAYIGGDVMQVMTSQLARHRGRRIGAGDTATKKAGDLLVRLDDADAKLAVAEATSSLFHRGAAPGGGSSRSSSCAHAPRRRTPAAALAAAEATSRAARA